MQLEKIKKGPISYISISDNSKLSAGANALELIVVSKQGSVLLIKDVDELTKSPPMTELFRHQNSCIHSLDTHPSSPLLAVGGTDGSVFVWNYLKKETVMYKYFEAKSVSSITFSPDGSLLGIGFANGWFTLVNSTTLNVGASRRHSVRLMFG